MDVWLIQVGEPLPLFNNGRLGRLGLLCENLVNRNHNVIRWASSFDHFSKKMLTAKDTSILLKPNYEIKIFKGAGYKNNISIMRWIDHCIVENKMIKCAKKQNYPDVIVVATPPHSLAFKFVKFAKKINIPVIVDIRDQWPDIFVEQLPKLFRRFGRYIFAYEYYKLKKTMFDADSVVAMMEDLLLWGVQNAHRKKKRDDKVFYIGAHLAENMDCQNFKTVFNKIIKSLNEKIVFTFVGTFNYFYNPSIIVDVAKIFYKENRNDVIFVLAGTGQFYEEVKKKADGLSNVIMTGWLNQNELAALLQASDVGICPLNQCRPCFPNKVFNYLSAQLPIITATPGEFQKILHKYNMGIYYEPGDKIGLYNAVIQMTDKNNRNTFKTNVKDKFERYFDAKKIYNEFADHIEKISNM
jgi:glycosyltransferase involved in cell wall biosynthesis